MYLPIFSFIFLWYFPYPSSSLSSLLLLALSKFPTSFSAPYSLFLPHPLPFSFLFLHLPLFICSFLFLLPFFHLFFSCYFHSLHSSSSPFLPLLVTFLLSSIPSLFSPHVPSRLFLSSSISLLFLFPTVSHLPMQWSHLTPPPPFYAVSFLSSLSIFCTFTLPHLPPS